MRHPRDPDTQPVGAKDVGARRLPSVRELAQQDEPVTAHFERVAVLGLGLIGGSLLRAMHRAGLAVVGYDTDLATTAAASSAGFAMAPTDAAAVHGADLVVLAMPLPDLEPALRSLAGQLGPRTVLTDVGTLKQPVLDLVRELVPETAVRRWPPARRHRGDGLGLDRPDVVPRCPVVAADRGRHSG